MAPGRAKERQNLVDFYRIVVMVLYARIGKGAGRVSRALVLKQAPKIYTDH